MKMLSRDYKVITVRPSNAPEWLELLDSYKGDIFHSPAWIDLLSKTYDFDIRASILLDSDGKVVAGLPYVCLSDIRGHRASSLPFCDFMDPLIRTREQWDCLAEEIISQNLSYKIRPLHEQIPLLDERFEVVNRARWHGLDLMLDVDKIWSGFHKSARTGVRKARKSEVKIRVAETEEDLRAFFDMHLGIRKNKYRLVAQPYQFFQHIWDQFIISKNGQLILAEHNDEVIAGMIFLRYKDTLYYKFSASVPTRLSVNPNELLMWEGIQYGKKIGCSYLDFGLSDWDQDGLNFFKRKFAKDEKVISFLQYTPVEQGSISQEMNRYANELLPKLTELFTDESVPSHITEQAGSLLYKYFS